VGVGVSRYNGFGELRSGGPVAARPSTRSRRDVSAGLGDDDLSGGLADPGNGGQTGGRYRLARSG
jgi:hypothetical protein